LAGIYIHIPFCKQRCNYCDFFKETTLHHTERFTEALRQELHMRRTYLNGASVHTIYFGGGTPSILSYEQFSGIFKSIKSNFQVDNDAEITLEANPDDLSPSYLSELQQLPFNRLSIGIQSFEDKELKAVNRRHTALQAIASVVNAREAGFNNISIDLIYGLPGQSHNTWQENLAKAFDLQPEHISAYGLTYEEGTGLWHQRAKGVVKETDDEVMLEMYRHMLLQMKKKGYDAYEISNFAIDGFRSRHNSSYWNMTPYLGAGPSAHSYDGKSRQWNISNLQEYMHGIETKQLKYEFEVLSNDDAYNDYVMVRLRTKEGIDLNHLLQHFGTTMHDWFLCKAEPYIKKGYLRQHNQCLQLTLEGIELSNGILAGLMKTD
jgi:oxygen-independent coproporphyrinogen-3 oxidase